MAIVEIVLILVISLCYAPVDSAVITSFPIVGIFTDENLLSSKNAFEVIKKRADLYHGDVLRPDTRDSYSISMEVCQHSIDVRGIAAVVDARPTNGICDNVCMLCNKFGVPHLTLGWQPMEDKANYPFTLSYYPDPELLSKAYATLITDVLKWDKFTVLYEDDGSFIRLQQVIHLWPYVKEPILFRKLIPGQDNRETFKHTFKVAKYNNYIIDCKVENIVSYMKEVVQIENSTQYSSFIFTSLEAYTLNFEDMPSNLRANMSTFSIMPQEAKITWNDYGVNAADGEKMETALAADALIHIEKAIRNMQINHTGDLEGGLPPNICRQPDNLYETWEIGKEFQETLLTTSAKGFTGNIEFDAEGKRTNLKLYYFRRTQLGKFTFSGYWESYKDNITIDETAPEIVNPTSATGAQIIKIGSKNQLPYLETKIDENGLVVNRGYAVDLINAIFDNILVEKGIELKAEFVVHEAIGDHIEGTKRWSHMMGALIDHQIEMAICDLSISSDRLSVVDFSTPFMTTGITMLFKEREPEEPNKFSFLEPLSLEVWLCLGTTYIVVSFILFICARMSQDDWVNPHPCNQSPENLENIWSLYNCTWLTMGAIMTQGCDILPRGFGSRWVSGMWWFFSLIVTSSYTANMSTFLSNSRRSNDIRDVKMLADQTHVSYGATRNSSTYKFFENSNDTLFKKLWTTMETTRPSVFTKNNDEGKDRVLRSKGNYAFFMESTAIRYYAERECQLKMVGNQLDAKEYGIAMPRNFQYKGYVDVAILHLQEAGVLTALENTWWVENDNEEHCKEKREEQSNKGDDGSLQMQNTSGIFLVLGAGTILGLIVAIIDFMMHAHEICVKEKVTFKDALTSEWKASLDPRVLHKAAAPPRSAQPSPSPTPMRERSQSRAVSVLRAASSFINFDEIY